MTYLFTYSIIIWVHTNLRTGCVCIAPMLQLVRVMCCSPLGVWKWRCRCIWRWQICTVGCECDCIISTKIGMVWTQLHSVRGGWWTYQPWGIYVPNQDSNKTESLQHLSGRQRCVPVAGQQRRGRSVGQLHTECQRWGHIHNENYVCLLMLCYKSYFKVLVLKMVDSV